MAANPFQGPQTPFRGKNTREELGIFEKDLISSVKSSL